MSETATGFALRAIRNEIIEQCAKAVETEECPFKDGPMADGWAEAWATALNRIRALALPPSLRNAVENTGGGQ